MKSSLSHSRRRSRSHSETRPANPSRNGPAPVAPFRCPAAATNAAHASERWRGATRRSASFRLPRSYTARAATSSPDGVRGEAGRDPLDLASPCSIGIAWPDSVAQTTAIPAIRTASATSPARAGREVPIHERCHHLICSRPGRNSKVTGPTAIRSPSRSGAAVTTAAPFSAMPLAEARSVSTHPDAFRSIRACVLETPASLSTTSLSGARPMLTDSPSKRNRCPRPLPAAMVRAKDTSEAPAEEDLVPDRSEEDEEEGGEDEEDERQHQLHRRLVGQLLGALRPFVAHLRGKHAKHFAERRSHPVGLHQRLHEGGERRQIDSPRQLAQGILADLAHPELADGDGQLLGERALGALLHHLGERSREVQPRFHRQGEQVDPVGQSPHDRALAQPHPIAQPEQRIRGTPNQPQ